MQVVCCSVKHPERARFNSYWFWSLACRSQMSGSGILSKEASHGIRHRPRYQASLLASVSQSQRSLAPEGTGTSEAESGNRTQSCCPNKIAQLVRAPRYRVERCLPLCGFEGDGKCSLGYYYQQPYAHDCAEANLGIKDGHLGFHALYLIKSKGIVHKYNVT
ncbi:hypothetical protein BU16DRAFT_60608 [Lophium mytilinum]|uniref:Uncharacterized protein n=1 Tax=Lophium mytilinum TaxID=390894 RepID=A0A6A6QSS8_9PEZI|nr:hypothetical protein BU16DRAFT_60608 [Lophium mytilinum]